MGKVGRAWNHEIYMLLLVRRFESILCLMCTSIPEITALQRMEVECKSHSYAFILLTLSLGLIVIHCLRLPAFSSPWVGNIPCLKVTNGAASTKSRVATQRGPVCKLKLRWLHLEPLFYYYLRGYFNHPRPGLDMTKRKKNATLLRQSSASRTLNQNLKSRSYVRLVRHHLLMLHSIVWYIFEHA